MSLIIKYGKPLKVILIILFIGTLCTSLYRDYTNLKQGYACDLRKRIVGARYMARGYSPYYFRWSPSYPVELCTMYESDAVKPNIITLPPGYTWLLQPLSSFQFPVIEKIWFAFQYISLLLIFSIFYFKNPDEYSKNLLLILYSFLLLSIGWMTNVSVGQSYLIFPLVLSMMYIFFNKHPRSFFYYGLIIGFCIWLRPSFIFFVLPFLFAEKKFLFLKGLFIMAAICLLQIIVFNQFNNWLDFFKSSATWLSFFSERNFKDYDHTSRFGIPAIIETQTNFKVYPLPGYTANLPLQLKTLFNVYASTTVYSCIFLCLTFSLVLIFFYKNKLKDPTRLLLLGFCFNYLSEVFIWIPKCDYYFVELFFPLCLLIYHQQKVNNWILILVFIGLFFSAYLVKIVPMQLLLGEYTIIGSLFLYIFTSLKQKKLQQE